MARRAQMADTRFLTTVVEQHVRAVLAAEQAIGFTKKPVVLRTGGRHEFDAVADDGSVVASIKSASGKTRGGRHPAGKVHAAISELYFLSLVDAPARQLILTTPDFYEIFIRTLSGKLTPGIEVRCITLPPDIQAEVAKVQNSASQEIFPVLDEGERAAIQGYKGGELANEKQ
jgi:hypothetical protein